MLAVGTDTHVLVWNAMAARTKDVNYRVHIEREERNPNPHKRTKRWKGPNSFPEDRKEKAVVSRYVSVFVPYYVCSLLCVCVCVVTPRSK